MSTQYLSKEAFKFRIVEQLKKPESLIHCLWRGKFDKKTRIIELQASEYCMDIVVRFDENHAEPQLSFVEYEPDEFELNSKKIDISNLDAENVEIVIEKILLHEEGFNLQTQLCCLTHNDYIFETKPANKDNALTLEINLKRKKMIAPKNASRYEILYHFEAKEKTITASLWNKTRRVYQPVILDMMLFEKIKSIKYWGKIKPTISSKVFNAIQPLSADAVKLITLSDFMRLILDDFPWINTK